MELAFHAVEAWPERFAAVPTLVIKLRVDENSGQYIHNLALRCQLRIEPQRRRYSRVEEARLEELFGPTTRWGDTLRPFPWTQVSMLLPGFEKSTDVNLMVPCSYDFEVAAARFLHSVDDGEIPLLLQFSGTVFARHEGGISVTQIPWDKEAPFRLPVRIWRELMNHYYPNGGWLRLRRETLDALMRFKARRALPTWDGVLEELLRSAGHAAAEDPPAAHTDVG